MAFDFAIYGKDGGLAVVAEAKSRNQTSATWAERWRQSFAASQAPFVLLIAKDHVYIWRTGMAASAHVFDTGKLMAKLLKRTHLQLQTLDPLTFELLVGSWLSEATWKTARLEEHSELKELGFVDAIQDGRVEHQAAA